MFTTFWEEKSISSRNTAFANSTKSGVDSNEISEIGLVGIATNSYARKADCSDRTISVQSKTNKPRSAKSTKSSDRLTDTGSWALETSGNSQSRPSISSILIYSKSNVTSGIGPHPAVMNAPIFPSRSDANQTQSTPSGYDRMLIFISSLITLKAGIGRKRLTPEGRLTTGHTGTSAPALGRTASVNRTLSFTPPSALTTWFSAHKRPTCFGSNLSCFDVVSCHYCSRCLPHQWGRFTKRWLPFFPSDLTARSVGKLRHQTTTSGPILSLENSRVFSSLAGSNPQ
ncbi:hypothetical protein BURCE16_31345 [Burkholderia cepacia]|nr:hypothetical protein BURCE16_31345 [Burkholderia cepacia]